MAWSLNPLNWFRSPRRKSSGEKLLLRLLPAMGWQRMGRNWAANRHELLGHWRGWQYVTGHPFAKVMAGQVMQFAYVDDASAAAGKMQKAWRSRKNLDAYGRFDRRKAADRVARLRIREKYLTGLRRKKANIGHIQHGDELVPLADDHRLVKLFRKPNPIDTSWDFNYKLAMWKRLAGVAYIYAVPANDGGVAELWPLPPNWLRPKAGTTSLTRAYELRPVMGQGMDQMAGWMISSGGAGEDIPAEQIIALGYPHPTNFLDYYSSLEAGAEWIDCGESIEKARVAQFQNGAYPGMVLELDSEIEDPDADDMERLKAKIKAAYSGVANRGETVILDKGMVLKPITTPPLEMDYVNSANQTRDNELALTQTPKSIVGLDDTVNFATMLASRANWFQNVLLPELTHTALTVTERICSKFQEMEGGRKIVGYYEDPTPIDPAQLNADLQLDTTAGIRTLNEARAARGLEPYPHGGDDPILPMGSSPVPWATGEEDDWLPVPEQQPEEQGTEIDGLETGSDDKPQSDSSLSRMEQIFGKGKNGHHLNGKAA